MATMNVTFEDNSEEVLEALKNAVERALDTIGSEAEKKAKDNITKLGAVDTGRLRNSITYATEKHTGTTIKLTKEEHKAGSKGTDTDVKADEPNTVYVGTGVYYGAYVELGTGEYASTGGGTPKPSWAYKDEFGNWHMAHPQKPRPFLNPAVSGSEKEFMEILKESLENA